MLAACAARPDSQPASLDDRRAPAAPSTSAPPAEASRANKTAPAVQPPARVVVDADTALISPDPGQRVMDAIAGNSQALDACLGDVVKLLEGGASPSVRISVDEKGKLTELELERLRGTSEGEGVSDCMRAILGKVDYGPSDFRRSGFFFFKAEPPITIARDLEADVATVEKTADGLQYMLEARRVPQKNGDFHLALAVTVKNTTNAPRGVRGILYSNEQAQHAPDDSIAHSGVLQTDTTGPITCLEPGKSVRIEQSLSRSDVTVAPGGRRRSDPFLVVGTCEAAATRVMLGGARLEWEKGTPKPAVIALPFWVHQLDPFEPRKVWRYKPAPSGKK
jgi:hypothetical protein